MPDATTALWFAEALLPSGWAREVRIEVRDGHLSTVEAGCAAQAGDERHGVALPGMPNLHSHAFQRGMAGLAERRGPGEDSFWTWRETMYHFVDRIGPAELEAIAALAFVEMLESGFTRVGEFHYLHNQRDGMPYADPAEMARAIAAAAAETGIGLTLLPVFYAHGGFGGAPPGEGQRRFTSTLDSFVRLREASFAAVADLPDALVGAAPHSLRAVTPEELQAVAALADSAPIHIHVAEQRREVDECLVWLRARPVEWLLDAVEVTNRWCLVHATHMTTAETQALAKSGAIAGLCPITEANLGDGIFPARAFVRIGGRFGIGSDSNVLVSLSEELRLLEYGQRLAALARNILSSEQEPSTGTSLFASALHGGAAALGVTDGIAAGLPADLFSLGAGHPSLAARSGPALLDAFVFAGAPVDCVWRRGERCVRGGTHHRRDAIVSRYRAALERLLAG